METPLARQYAQVMERIESARCRAGRAVGAVRLLAVTKSATLEQIAELVQLGHRDLGENRVQQLAARAEELGRHIAPELAQTVRWHMIGHLQRNKVREVLPRVACLHSVDSLRLAQAVSEEGQRRGGKARVLLQVNASLEPQKYGVPLAEAVALGEQMAGLAGLELCGVMTMAALTDDVAEVRGAFARARGLFETLASRLNLGSFRELSMGMSHDFELAIAEGATLVRVGSAIFAGEVKQ